MIPISALYHPQQLLDNGELNTLIPALQKHLQYLSQFDDDISVKIGRDYFSYQLLKESTSFLLEYLNHKPDNAKLAEFISTHYNLYQASGRKTLGSPEMLITGYYEPFLYGSYIRKWPYIFPLYSPPEDLVVTKGDSPTIGRLNSKGKLVPYWSRKEITEKDLLKGKELVYLKDRISAFSLHIQGSGKIVFEDGSEKSIHYAGHNGRQYNAIGKLLVDRGTMELSEVTMPKIREYLENNPDQIDQIFFHNEKYIFFKWADTNEPPIGSSGVSLTAGRSIAIDPETLPMGCIGFLSTRQPVFDSQKRLTGWLPFNRFVLPQDSGSAIEGAGRADIFWGNGNYAKAAAGEMSETGTLYFLVKK